ncbi:MAG: substrate-binding domain-containing protein [Rhodomicrobiaceae bacterium]
MRYQSIEFLTTKELADLLRIKERRVYDLASSGEVPCSRATGKLLFPRKAIDQWLVENGSGFSALRRKERANIVVGSHDPLLEWALRESRSDLASLFDSSVDGLERFKDGSALSAGMHLYSSQGNVWNEHIVAEEIEFRRAVLVEWAWRERGFIVAKSNPQNIASFEDLNKKTVAGRQAGAGSSLLLQSLADRDDFSLKACKFTAEQRSELDCALQVAEGKADVAFGLKSFADQLNLDFVPVIKERYDLLVCRKGWFDPSFQTLIDFTRNDKFKEKAAELGGYDISEIWSVRYNGE